MKKDKEKEIVDELMSNLYEIREIAIRFGKPSEYAPIDEKVSHQMLIYDKDHTEFAALYLKAKQLKMLYGDLYEEIYNTITEISKKLEPVIKKLEKQIEGEE